MTVEEIKQLKPKDRISWDGIEGTVIGIEPRLIRVITDDGRKIYIDDWLPAPTLRKIN